MTSRNSRTNRPAARSSRAPQSARAVRSARAAQSGRIASRSTAAQFSRNSNADPSAYRSAYTPNSQGRSANSAYSRQTAASQYSRANPNYSQASAKRMSRGKKIALGVVAAVLVVAIGGGSAFALWFNSINDQLNRGTKTEEELGAIADALAPVQTKSFTEPFYMMLIGSDRREDNSAEGARSDTNIVVRVDPTQNLASMVSIPRDTMIEIDNVGRAKFNAAYNYGGAAATIREAKELCNIEIAHYAEVNFEELVELVDAVGGVDVVVDERIDDPDAGSIVIEEGEQHLDGEAALVFARSRAYVDGDFTRTANQRKLIMALAEKVLALPVTELPGVIQGAAKAVTTDLSVNDIIALAQQFKDEGDLTIYSAMLPSTIAPELIDGVSYVLNDPVATKEMMKVMEAGGDPSEVVATGYVDPQYSGSGGQGSSGGSAGNGGTYYEEPIDNGSVDPGYDPNYDPNYDPDYDPNYDPGYVDPGTSDGGYVDPGYVDPGTGGMGGAEAAA
ncbi:LCP family protein [Arabiibacter massiliensis]|uniref:LCP family protein n=1 Tax=Arabiibacter massiliensis TaxID=1870985 RepID=UPI0009BA3328|nr:LCP family protein [Arabiibacter massiliensis]